MRRIVGAAAMLAVLGTGAAAEEPSRYPEFTFKRVAVPQGTAPRRITVQIDPAEQAAYIAALPKPSARTESSAESEGEAQGTAPQVAGVQASPDAATAYPWFWQAVSPSIAAASPGRLGQAIAGLGNGPGGSAVPAPRLQTMQQIAETHGADILRYSIGTRVSPALVLAVIGIESAGRADAVSHKGATGLMQLMPATAERFGVSDINVASENIRGGIAYLDWLMEEFGGDPMMVLAGYNAGEGAVKQHGGVPPYRETRDYVPKVLAAWNVARNLCVTPPELLTDGCVFSIQSAGL